MAFQKRLLLSVFVGLFAIIASSDALSTERSCGKSLMRRVSNACQEHTCPPGVDMSWLMGDIDPKAGFQGLARECCMRGCTASMINAYCCVMEKQESFANKPSVASLFRPNTAVIDSGYVKDELTDLAF
ncbi:hypothetical protein AAVH_26855 [Aphelenchoides avenae]|nr:hypothetical protein AAVH_26855 [Aphelenchus avenae]